MVVRVLFSARNPAHLRKWHLGNRRLVRIVIGGGAFAIAIGLLSAELIFSAASDPGAGLSDKRATVVATEPATFDIVPTSVIETKPVFFFGTGDNSAGFYTERPSP